MSATGKKTEIVMAVDSDSCIKTLKSLYFFFSVTFLLLLSWELPVSTLSVSIHSQLSKFSLWVEKKCLSPNTAAPITDAL